MKQLRQMSILVRGAQLLLLVLALFLVVWLVPDAGKKHASGTEASEAETDGGDVLAVAFKQPEILADFHGNTDNARFSDSVPDL